MGNIYVAVNKWLTNFSTMSHIHKWDGSQWIQLPINKLLNNRITCMLTDKTGNLYVAGLFTNDSTTHLKGRKFVAKWDGVQWSEVGNANSKLNANEAITTMYFDSAENLYVRGGFTDSITYTKGTKYIAKWDGLQWSKFACDTTFVKKANSYGLRIDNNNNFFVSSKKK
jgi:hypothetical protein